MGRGAKLVLAPAPSQWVSRRSVKQLKMKNVLQNRRINTPLENPVNSLEKQIPFHQLYLEIFLYRKGKCAISRHSGGDVSPRLLLGNIRFDSIQIKEGRFSRKFRVIFFQRIFGFFKRLDQMACWTTFQFQQHHPSSAHPLQ